MEEKKSNVWRFLLPGLYLIRALIYSACVLQNEILQKSGSPLALRQEVLKDIHLYKECPEMMEINISLKNFWESYQRLDHTRELWIIARDV